MFIHIFFLYGEQRNWNRVEISHVPAKELDLTKFTGFLLQILYLIQNIPIHLGFSSDFQSENVKSNFTILWSATGVQRIYYPSNGKLYYVTLWWSSYHILNITYSTAVYFYRGALVINMLYIKAGLTINTSISKMKFIWFFSFLNVIFSTSSVSITQSGIEYNEIRVKLYADMDKKHGKMDEEHRHTHLRRNGRDFTNTIEKMPSRLRNDLVQHQRFVRQTEMCNQAPCQKMPFIVSYQVK